MKRVVFLFLFVSAVLILSASAADEPLEIKASAKTVCSQDTLKGNIGVPENGLWRLTYKDGAPNPGENLRYSHRHDYGIKNTDIGKGSLNTYFSPSATDKSKWVAVPREGWWDSPGEAEDKYEGMTIDIQVTNKRIYYGFQATIDACKEIVSATDIHFSVTKVEEPVSPGSAAPPVPEEEPEIINEKEMSLYTDGTVFIISDYGWQNVMKLVPVAFWTGEEKCHDIYAPEQGIKRHVCGYPALIYRRETEKWYDADSIIQFLKQYKAKRVLLVGEGNPQELINIIGAIVGKDSVKTIYPKEYTKFWKSWKTGVVVEYNYNKTIMASVYAAYLNAPLFTTDDALTGEEFEKKEFICIGNVKNIDCKKTLTLDELQREYIKLVNPEKVILVNPQDVYASCENERFKGDYYFMLYCHDSLAAPFMAAAKDAVIINAPGRTLEKLKPWFQNTINTKNGLFQNYRDVKYLITIAGDKAIDMGSKYNNAHSVERQLVNFDDDLDEEIPFGRIMGITTSDTSSYIMRSIFYEELYENVYGNEKPKLIAVSHFLDYTQNFLAPFVHSIKGKYDAECYVRGDEFTRGVCKKNTKPPIDSYKHKNIILFIDHGWSGGWAETMKSKEIPKLDLSVGIGAACLTNSYKSVGWVGTKDLFGANFLRKGGIGYYGALSVTADLINPTEYKLNIGIIANRHLSYALVHRLIEEMDNLGRTLEHTIGNFYLHINKKAIVLLGDPSLNPKLPKVDIGYYPDIPTLYEDAYKTKDGRATAMENVIKRYEEIGKTNSFMSSIAKYYIAKIYEELGNREKYADIILDIAENSNDIIAKRYAFGDLCEIGGKRAVNLLVDAIRNADSNTKVAAINAIGNMAGCGHLKDTSVVGSLLMGMINDKNKEIQRTVESSLALIYMQPLNPDLSGLVKLFEGKPLSKYKKLAMCVGVFAPKWVVPEIIGLLKNNDKEVRVFAAVALMRTRREKRNAVAALIGALVDKNDDVRAAAAESLGWIKDKDALPGLEERLKVESSGKVKTALESAIKEIKGGS